MLTKITVVTCMYADEDGREELVSVRPSMELAIEEVYNEGGKVGGALHSGEIEYNGEFGSLEVESFIQGKLHVTYYLREEELL